ncbi:MAG: hypothetical protein AB1696_23435 [Planctomycetota bacterium]
MTTQSRIRKLEREGEKVLRRLRKANLRWKVEQTAEAKAEAQRWQDKYNRLATELREAYNEKGA